MLRHLHKEAAMGMPMGSMLIITMQISKLQMSFALARVVFYDVTLHCCELCMLASYFQWFQKPWSNMRCAVSGVCVVTVGCFLAAVFLTLIWCGYEISSYWSVNRHDGCTFLDRHLLMIDSGVNLATDIIGTS
jgi:hypothetical protein